MSNQFKRFWPIALILAAILIFFYPDLFGNGGDTETLSISGTLQAVEVVVAIEEAGQITAVMVERGDLVQAGDVLVRFEDEILQARFEQAEMALAQAKTEYDLIFAQPLDEQRLVAIADAQIELLSARQALEGLLEDADLAYARAQQAVEDAEQALEDGLNLQLRQAAALENIAIADQAVDQAEEYLMIVISSPPQSAIDQAYANMLMAENRVNKTSEDIAHAKQKLKHGPKWYWPKESKTEFRKQFRNLIKNLEIKLAWDQLAYQNTTEKYHELLEPVDPIELAVAEAGLAIAQAQLEQAQREYERIKDGPSEADIAVLEAQVGVAKREYEALADGPDPDDLAIAKARVRIAEANLALAQADTIQEQLAVARAEIEAAEASLATYQIQLDKLVLTAPVEGTVLHRFVEVGEVVAPGRVAVMLADLDDLTITVYVPQDDHRQIRLGDLAFVHVNSAPGERFDATVTRVSGRTEYIPLNVQASEGESAAVLAVTLTVSNLDGKLKPGMPAEVSFVGR